MLIEILTMRDVSSEQIMEWIRRARECRLAAENKLDHCRQMKLLNLATMLEALAGMAPAKLQNRPAVENTQGIEEGRP